MHKLKWEQKIFATKVVYSVKEPRFNFDRQGFKLTPNWNPYPLEKKNKNNKKNKLQIEKNKPIPQSGKKDKW